MIKKDITSYVAIILSIQLFIPQKIFMQLVTVMTSRPATTFPAMLKSILQRSCYDCHSNNTSYPWYNKYMQPVTWVPDHHVQEAPGLADTIRQQNHLPAEH